MDKPFLVTTAEVANGQGRFLSYDAAEKHAKTLTAQNGKDYAIFEAKAVTNTPIPQIEVTKL